MIYLYLKVNNPQIHYSFIMNEVVKNVKQFFLNENSKICKFVIQYTLLLKEAECIK